MPTAMTPTAAAGGRLLRCTFVLGAAATILLSACSGSGSLVDPAGGAPVVHVHRSGRSLEILNPGAEPLAYMVVEADFAARAQFALCHDPGPECLRLPARGRVSVPYSGIAGYEAGDREAMVYTWRVVPAGGGGYEATGLSTVRVRL